MPIAIEPQDWHEYARRLAGRVFDLEITLIAVQRQLSALLASTSESEKNES